MRFFFIQKSIAIAALTNAAIAIDIRIKKGKSPNCQCHWLVFFFFFFFFFCFFFSISYNKTYFGNVSITKEMKRLCFKHMIYHNSNSYDKEKTCPIRPLNFSYETFVNNAIYKVISPVLCFQLEKLNLKFYTCMHLISYLRKLGLNSLQSGYTMHKPRHGKITVIAYANSRCSGESAHSRSLARTYAVRSRKRQVKGELQRKSLLNSNELRSDKPAIKVASVLSFLQIRSMKSGLTCVQAPSRVLTACLLDALFHRRCMLLYGSTQKCRLAFVVFIPIGYV